MVKQGGKGVSTEEGEMRIERVNSKGSSELHVQPQPCSIGSPATVSQILSFIEGSERDNCWVLHHEWQSNSIKDSTKETPMVT